MAHFETRHRGGFASICALGIGQGQPLQNNISLQGFTLLTKGTSQEAYLSAWLLVNSASPLKTVHVFLNDSDQGTFSYSNNLGSFFIRLQAPVRPTVPIQNRNTYLTTAVATFADGSTYTASTYGWAVYAVE